MSFFSIVFENENFIAADKAAGVLSVPSRFEKDDPRPCLGRLLEAHAGGRLWPIHRLDFEVSGLLLFARNEQAHRLANRSFEERRVRKVYQALSENPQQILLKEGQHFEWKSKLLRGKRRSYPHERGQLAITRATVKGTSPDLRWQLEPHTGRAHQLRVHLSAAQFPIRGDLLYGASRPFAENQIALKSVALDFSDSPELLPLGLPGLLECRDFF